MIDARSIRLVEIIQKISLCQSLDDIIDTVRKAAREIAEADGATFVLREGDQCHYVDEDAIGPLFKGKLFPAAICISGTAMFERRTIIVPDIYEDPRIPIEVYRPTFVKSVCMTPIRFEAPLGAIGVYWKDFHIASEGEALALSALANATSIAIENVYLHTQLKARLEQVTRLSRLKDEFLRNLSHELRTPLNQIMGWVQLLKEDASPEELKEGLQSIESSGLRQDAIIKDLLDCSKLVSGEMVFHPVNFDLSELISPVLETFRVALDGKKLNVRVNCQATSGFVIADKNRCREILWHLISNAVKFSKPGSEILVNCYRDDENSILEIIDHGIGIDSEFLPRVFDLFAQADAGITRTYAGTGLGLSICRYLAEAQGGTITVASSGLGLGTIATLELPTAAIRFNPRKSVDPAYMSTVLEHLVSADMRSGA